MKDARNAGTSPLLSVQNLHTEIRLERSTVKAVDGVSFSLGRGQALGLVGESGCGKTTIALSIMRLLPVGGSIAQGSIVLDGVPLESLPEAQMRSVRGRQIGMIFQDPLSSLNPTMPIGVQIAEALRLHRHMQKSEAMQRAMAVLGRMGIAQPEKRMDDYPHQFSGGMRQRVMIAMALACEPDLLIADEPTTALDVTIQAQILELMSELRAAGLAMVLVSHDLGVIAGRVDKVAVMYAGRIVEIGDTETVFGDAQHPYTHALFGALPENASGRARLMSLPGMPPDLSKGQQGCRFAPRCSRATDDCWAVEPTLVPLGPGHAAACIHPAGRAGGRRTVGSVESGLCRSEQDLGAGVDIVKVQDLVKEYRASSGLSLGSSKAKVSALSGVSISVKQGQVFGLVGESGCGKSTLGRLIAALEHPTSGSIELAGREITGLSDRQLRPTRRQVQLMFQDSYASLDPRMRVGSIVREPLTLQRIGSRKEQAARVAQLLDEVGLAPSSVERYPHEFSGGQRQRIGLARALALDPAVLVADEPVSGLDVSIQAQILNLIRDLQRLHQLTVVLISHDLSVVTYLSDTVGVMYMGKLVETGEGGSFHHQAMHPYTKGLIASRPVPDPVRERSKAHVAVGGELPSPYDPPSGCRFHTRCPLAQDVCAEIEPPLRNMGVQNHSVACHMIAVQ